MAITINGSGTVTGASTFSTNAAFSGFLSTASGINFTSNPGGLAQATLNDYEIGTYTSTISYSSTVTNTSSNATLTVSAGYIKIGKMVFVQLPTMSRDGTFGGNAVIFRFSLPFPADGSNVCGQINGYNITGRYNTSTFSNYWPYIVYGSSTTAAFGVNVPASGSGYTSLEASGASITGTVIYVSTV